MRDILNKCVHFVLVYKRGNDCVRFVLVYKRENDCVRFVLVYKRENDCVRSVLVYKRENDCVRFVLVYKCEIDCVRFVLVYKRENDCMRFVLVYKCENDCSHQENHENVREIKKIPPQNQHFSRRVLRLKNASFGNPHEENDPFILVVAGKFFSELGNTKYHVFPKKKHMKM